MEGSLNELNECNTRIFHIQSPPPSFIHTFIHSFMSSSLITPRSVMTDSRTRTECRGVGKIELTLGI